MKWDGKMSRKKVVIVDEELKPTVLYTKKRKKGSVLWIFIIFAIFIAVVYYLPEIVVYVNDYVNPDTSSTVNLGNASTDDEEEEEEEVVEVEEYQITADLQIEMENFTLTNFAIANDQISFTITNTSTDIIDFSEYDYFMNLYNANNTLVQRIMISDITVVGGGTMNVTYDLTSSDITMFTFIEIPQDSYPAHVVEADENGYAVLTCTKNYETVNYSLSNNAAYTIEDIYTVAATDANYATLYSMYQALAMTYDAIGGIDSSVTVEDNLLVFRTVISLNTVDESSFNNIIYYPLNTDARIISFELEANGYTCN